MKLHDIISEAPFTDKQEDNFLRAIQQQEKKKGWPKPMAVAKLVKKHSPTAKKVGAGVFSQAFGSDKSSVVVKITMDGDGEDTLRFLQWAKKQNNPHLPVLFTVKKIGSEDAHVYARMEKLVPLYPKKYHWKSKDVPFLLWMYKNGYGFPETFVPDWEEIQRAAQLKNIKSSKLLKTMQALNKMGDGELDIDLFGGQHSAHNIMLRPSTNTIVVHDPF